MQRFLATFVLLIPAAVRGDDLLFFGNSFTSYNDLAKMVETIAASRKKVANTTAITKGGQGFPYHLNQPTTDPALKSKAWTWIVLQDQSLAATKASKMPAEFPKYGELFYDRIAAGSPKSNILLYETWAFSPKHSVYQKTATAPAAFADPAAMLSEIRTNYAALQSKLQAKDAGRRVVVAPVGTAFANSLRKHPEINLYTDDLKHPNTSGTYLAACVIYATAFKDSPVGAEPGRKVDAKAAKALQEIAAETVR